MDELTREQIITLATRANKARRAGVSDAEVNEWLADNYNIDRATLFQMLKAQPKEVAPEAINTSELIKLMDQGSSFGLGGGVDEDRAAQLKDMGYGPEMNAMRGIGAAGSALGLGAAGTTLNILRKTGLGLAPQLMRGATVASKAIPAGQRATWAINALRELSPSTGAAVKGGAEALGAVAKAGLKSKTVKGIAGVYAAKKLGIWDDLLNLIKTP